MVKRVVTYVCGNFYYCFVYHGTSDVIKSLYIHGFVDVDWVGGLHSWSTNSVYVFNFFRGAMTLMSKRNPTFSFSTIELDYMATTHASKEVVWLQILGNNIGFDYRIVRIGCDS